MVRRLLVAAFVLTVFGLPSTARAQALPAGASLTIAASVAMNPMVQPLAAVEAEQVGAPLPVVRSSMLKSPSKVGINAVLASLYATTATMQVLDADSTLKSLNRGAIEVNPLMSGLVKNRTAFIAAKAGIAAVTIYAANRIAKNNKVGAIATMVAINSAYAMIVKNNYAIANR